MTITIGTQRNLTNAHYIGRNGDSSLGNPFAAAGNTVANVVKGYRCYFNEVIERGATPGEAIRIAQAKHPELKLRVSTGWKVPTAAQMVKELQAMKAKLKAGEPLELACHCYTQPTQWTGVYQHRCHAEPIAAWLTWQLNGAPLPIKK